MNKNPRRGPMTAAELREQLANDPVYQARKRERDQELEERRERYRQAEIPIVEDLKAAGVEVSSVWDLVNTATPYPDALPILMDHFERGGYPDRVMNGLGRALAVKPSVVYWDRLTARWLGARSDEEKDGAAVALAASATKAQVDDLIAFLGDETQGETRIYFLRRLWRLGGERGRSIIEGLREHPVLGKESDAIVRKIPPSR